MNKYSRRSQQNFDTLHPDLQRLMLAVLEEDDHSIVFGHRPPQMQHQLFEYGRRYDIDQQRWVVFNKASVVTNCDGYKIKSRHNDNPSTAVDAYPFINGKMSNKKSDVIFFMGKVYQKARELGIEITWGGDWDGDKDTTDNVLEDYAHIQLKKGA